MKTGTIAIVSLMLALGSSDLVAQDAAQDAKLRASMSAGAYAEFSSTVRDARSRGLPTDPLVAKALEGTAKSVPGERIVVALRQMSDRMTRAQLMLKTTRPTTSAEIVAVSDALQRNVPEDALRKIASDPAGRATIVLSSYALADLIGQGVPLAVGVEVIAAWRASGGDTARLKEVPATIERLVRQGAAPSRAGTGVAAGLRIGKPLSTITRLDLK